ncbi:MAG: hypothetical protein LBQ24_00960 [Candidatus Peribacteria bacterium]|jgi:hypothetical protein|nr:hypothetical protein [Candidatus Peribacteria bacterium]
MQDILGIIRLGEVVETCLVHHGEVGEVVMQAVDDEHNIEVVRDEVEHKQEQYNVYVVQII